MPGRRYETKGIFMRKCFGWLSIILGLFLLSACTTPPIVVVSKDPETLRREKIAEYRVLLMQAGVLVEQVGETMRIIIPGDGLFNPHSANISPFYGMPTLNLVARLMVMLETTSAEISGYTNTEFSPQLDQVMSKRQAEVVLDYLWLRGIDSRLLYAIGFGCRRPLAADPVSWANRRIEINFRFFPLGLGR